MKANQCYDLPADYRPSPDDAYMNPSHVTYFRNRLLERRAAVLKETRVAEDEMRSLPREVGDEADQASKINEIGWVIGGQERALHTLRLIDAALKRIDTGDYGYCEDTGEEIGLARLEANPMATLTVCAQEHRERCSFQTLRSDRRSARKARAA